eukprot:g32023.t1
MLSPLFLSRNVADGPWVGYWVKWAGLNLQWSVLSPICTFAALWLLCGKAGAFTLGDLYKEIAYAEAVAVVPMKGSKLAEAVKFSRSKEGEKPGFLHLEPRQRDVGSFANEKHELVEVNKKPFDANKVYKVALQRALLQGMNEITPLQEFAKENGVPDEEQRPRVRGAGSLRSFPVSVIADVVPQKELDERRQTEIEADSEGKIARDDASTPCFLKRRPHLLWLPVAGRN